MTNAINPDGWVRDGFVWRHVAPRPADDLELLTDARVRDRDLVDEVAVQRAVNGEPTALTPRERREAVRRVHAENVNDAEIAERVGCSVRTVWRIREQLGLAKYEPVFEFSDHYFSARAIERRERARARGECAAAEQASKSSTGHAA